MLAAREISSPDHHLKANKEMTLFSLPKLVWNPYCPSALPDYGCYTNATPPHSSQRKAHQHRADTAAKKDTAELMLGSSPQLLRAHRTST